MDNKRKEKREKIRKDKIKLPEMIIISSSSLSFLGLDSIGKNF